MRLISVRSRFRRLGSWSPTVSLCAKLALSEKVQARGKRKVHPDVGRATTCARLHGSALLCAESSRALAIAQSSHLEQSSGGQTQTAGEYSVAFEPQTRPVKIAVASSGPEVAGWWSLQSVSNRVHHRRQKQTRNVGKRSGVKRGSAREKAREGERGREGCSVSYCRCCARA